MLDCDGFAAEIYGAYVLGTLAPTDRGQIEAHLAQNCRNCQLELTATKRTWTAVALAAPDRKPRPALRRRVVASVQGTKTGPFGLPFAVPAPVFAVTLALIAAGGFAGGRYLLQPTVPGPLVQTLPSSAENKVALATLTQENAALRERLRSAASRVPAPPSIPAVQPSAALFAQQAVLQAELDQARNRLRDAEQELALQKQSLARANTPPAPAPAVPQTPAELVQVRQQLTRAQVRVAQLEQDVAEYRTLLASARQRLAPVQTASLLADPALRLVRLRSTVKGSPVEAHALIASRQVALYATGLPALAPGRAYQVWLLRSASPAIVSAGVFLPDSASRAQVGFDNATLASNVTSIAVTDEPSSGSALPTGHKLLVGF